MPHNHPLTLQKSHFLDPEGNGFELYYDVGADGLERIRRGDAATFAPLNLEA